MFPFFLEGNLNENVQAQDESMEDNICPLDTSKRTGITFILVSIWKFYLQNLGEILMDIIIYQQHNHKSKIQSLIDFFEDLFGRKP